MSIFKLPLKKKLEAMKKTIRLYRCGFTPEQISNIVGHSVHQVNKWIKEYRDTNERI